MAQQTPSLRDKGYKQHLDQAIALSTLLSSKIPRATRLLRRRSYRGYRSSS
jgi:hypothetical protein